MATNNTNTNTNNATLASRAAVLLSKSSALAVVEKTIAQAITAKRVHPAMAEDFGAQLGHELPLKTRDFVKVVGHLLQASEKPFKGIISKRKSEILSVLAEVVGVLTDTPAISLPAWALPKPKATKAEAEAEASAEATGALDKANTLALAEANAEKAEKAADAKLAAAISLIVANAAALTKTQRDILAAALATEATEASEASEASEA